MIRYAGVLLVGAALGAWINGNRWEAEYVTLERDQAQTAARRSDNNLAAVAREQARVREALDSMREYQTRSEKDYAALNASVSSLRGTVGGLRGDFAGLPGFLRDANRESLSAYANACTVVFERLAERGASMAEAGARVARQADLSTAEALGR